MTSKKVLVITYYWPPAGGPGVQRVLKFVKYLPQFGWEPVILTVKSGEYQAIDESLKSDLSRALKVYKTKAFSFYGLFKKITGEKAIPTHQLSEGSNDSFFSKLSRWIRLNVILPDGRIGWYPFALAQAIEIFRKESIKIIFSSGPPHSIHLIARSLSKKYTIPWIADFRDPWTERFYYEESRRLKIIGSLDLMMEKAVINQAILVTTVSDGFKKLILTKNIETSKCVVVTNGYDDTDFPTSFPPKQTEKTIITHVGNLAKSQMPTALIQALQRFRSEKKSSFILNIIGNIHDDLRLSMLGSNLADIVRFQEYLPHDKVIFEMAKADYVFAVIPKTKNNKGIIPAKIFEYMRSGTPILLIGPNDCDAANIILSSNAGFVFDYSESDKIFQILESRRTLISDNIEQYSRFKLTKDLANLLNINS